MKTQRKNTTREHTLTPLHRSLWQQLTSHFVTLTPNSPASLQSASLHFDFTKQALWNFFLAWPCSSTSMSNFAQVFDSGGHVVFSPGTHSQLFVEVHWSHLMPCPANQSRKLLFLNFRSWISFSIAYIQGSCICRFRCLRKGITLKLWHTQCQQSLCFCCSIIFIIYSAWIVISLLNMRCMLLRYNLIQF